MLTQDPVKIPEIPKKIRFKEKDGTQYVQYLEGRKYDSNKKHNVPDWVNIGKRIESMPSMMYPNDNYERIFCDEEREAMEENKTGEISPEPYVRDTAAAMPERYEAAFLAEHKKRLHRGIIWYKIFVL